MHLRSPRLGMLAPSPSHIPSRSERDWYEDCTSKEQLDTGITVSQAPVSTATSIPIQSPLLASEAGDKELPPLLA